MTEEEEEEEDINRTVEDTIHRDRDLTENMFLIKLTFCGGRKFSPNEDTLHKVMLLN